MNVAVLGFGVVGSGTVEVIDKNADKITQGAGQEIRVKYILDVRNFDDSPYGKLIINDFSVIENDPSVGVVVETIGGAGVAYDFTRRSLAAGKSVVTSNKELVAKHGYELLTLAREKGVNYLFEASVGGGIPIIRPITQCLAANKIDEIYGILNGTTNYILSEMITKRTSLAAALADAKEKGYAEANPADDIEGHDACRKICILSALCFGKHLYPEFVPAEGIMNVTSEDVVFANLLGFKIKLLGRAKTADGGKVAAYVAPHLINGDNLLSGVEGVMNGIVVRGNAIGDVMFYGAGAGKMPTASAVVADVIDAAKHSQSKHPTGWQEGGAEFIADPDLLETAWYIRTDAAGDEIKKVFGIVTVVEYTFEQGVEYAFKTAGMNKKDIEDISGGKINVLSKFRILD